MTGCRAPIVRLTTAGEMEGDMAMVSEQAIDRVASQAELNGSYLVLMAVAGVLAAVARLTNSVPVLIGAMIVAPALSPVRLSPSPS